MAIYKVNINTEAPQARFGRVPNQSLQPIDAEVPDLVLQARPARKGG